jgi:hypothetical protein
MSDVTSLTGYSPPINITLKVNDTAFEVADVGPDHVMLRSARDYEPVRAVLVINIDGRIKTRDVMLPEGIQKGRDRQPIIRLETASLAKAS